VTAFWRNPREVWHRDMVLSTGKTVDLEWQSFGSIAMGGETLLDAPRGIVRINAELTSGEAWEVRHRLKDEDAFFANSLPDPSMPR
jgi:hypothetical protein